MAVVTPFALLKADGFAKNPALAETPQSKRSFTAPLAPRRILSESYSISKAATYFIDKQYPCD
ncbi:MAG: hypothetical protein HY885_17570 [Deltaproteobacteria bacterium]|nr:hypothetical protein [Deltaproteobacteria bacterium]